MGQRGAPAGELPPRRSPAGRKTVYCVIPEGLAADLHDYLREHWRDDRSIRVLVERRGSDRRRAERRAADEAAPGAERRRILSKEGRRVADRRAMAVAAATPIALPPRAVRHAHALTFIERVEPADRDAEDLETNRLVIRAQAGEEGAFDLLYMRYFDRVYAYARVALRDGHEAEDIAQQVFANVIQALPRYEVREDTPFRAWLFRITRNAVLRALSRSGRLRIEEPAELDRRLESPTPRPMSGLDWLSDDDLAILIERLPLSQRQVILLRYVFEFSTDEIAVALERTPVAVRMLEHRAMRALERRLACMRDGPRHRRSSMVIPVRPTPALASRRLAIDPRGALVRPLGLTAHRYR